MPTEYKRLWELSKERTTALLDELQDSSSIYRKVAFRLSSTTETAFDTLVRR